MLSRQIFADYSIGLELKIAIWIQSAQFSHNFRDVIDDAIINFFYATTVAADTAPPLNDLIVVIDVYIVFSFHAANADWFWRCRIVCGGGCSCRTGFNKIDCILYVLSQFQPMHFILSDTIDEWR